MDILQAIHAASQRPEVGRAVDMIQQKTGNMPITADGLKDLIKMLEFALQKPQAWPEIRRAAIADKLADEEDLPQQFDAKVIMSLLAAMYELQRRAPKEEMARGGLSRAARELAAAGRGPDTTLAHVTPAEISALRNMGGSGSINPRTGLPEFGWFSDLVKVALPIVVSFVAPELAPFIGEAMGATGTAATMLGSAVIGGVSAGVTGGDPLKGAVLGGLGAGLGSTVGGGISDALQLNLGQASQNMLGSALVGGVAGAATGQGFGKGALMGAVGSGLGAAAQGVGEGALGAGIGAAGRYAGNMMAAGYSPKQALLGGALSGLATSLTYKPSEAVVAEMREAPGGINKLTTDFQPGEFTTNPETGETYYPGGMEGTKPTPAKPGFLQQMFGAQPTTASGTGLQEPPGTPGGPPAETGMSPLKTAATLAVLSSVAGGRPPAVDQAIQTLSPAQQEYFNRPSIQWDWSKLQNDANSANMSLSQYMASYWPQITSGTYNMPLQQPKMARGGVYAMGGGPLGAVARLARGAGSGRDDTIDARLSDGEYVMDAETVAMLGDGSTEAGARRLDDMRAQLRKHKGKALSKGKFSPNAKSPLAYLKGAA